MERFDVTVVGASFAGCATAIRAAQLGLKVLLIDKKSDPGDKLHTTGIIVRDAIDRNPFLQNIPPQLTRRIEHIRLFSPSLKEVLLQSPGYYFLATDTPELMRWLVGQTQLAGVEVRLGQLFTHAEQHQDGVSVEGMTRAVQSRFLVGADEPQSKVAKAFKLGNNTRFLYGVEHELQGTTLPDPNSLYCFSTKQHAKGYIGWALQGVHDVQVGTARRYPSDAQAGGRTPNLEGFLSHIEPVLEFKNALRTRVRAGYIPCGGVVSPLGAERVLLVGDAAGLVSPVTAGGIHTAWKYGWQMGEAVAEHLLRAGEHPTLSAARLYPQFTLKRFLRWGFDTFQTDFLFDTLLHTKALRAAAQQVYFHSRG